MRGFRRCFLLTLITLGILHKKSVSQILVADTFSSAAVKTAINLYSNSFADQLHLYNGKEYNEYPLPFEEGHPYFMQDQFSIGTI